jgi:ABC-type transport system involved in multi-copper enzyme maturation permease subunit/regulation of enolase protein 1 (concanavalin A-like superfamily)
MSTTTIARPEPDQLTSRFADLVRAEWTKFRTVRGWIIAMLIAVLLMVAFGLLGGSANIACASPNGHVRTGKACVPPVTLGPGGEPVTDGFSIIYQPLTGNGSITTRLVSLTGEYPSTNQVGANVPMSKGLQPWSKAGIIIKNGLRQGSAYAAMLATGSNGTRMQYNFTGDLAGLPGLPTAAAPRWLRLTRSGDTVTGYDSTGGSHWVKVGTVVLAGLPGTVQVGMFATSPGHNVIDTGFGGGSFSGGPSEATGVFDHVSLTGAGRAWSKATVNGLGGGMPVPSPTRAGGRFTVTGSGDIAPLVAGPGGGGFPSATVSTLLVGAFAALIVIVVVAAMFMTVEYRRGLIRLTLAASPHRGRVLAAKAVVVAAVTFTVGVIAGTIVTIIGVRLSSDGGVYVFPYSWLTAVRVVAGTAALLAVAAVLALAIATMVRRSAAAIATVIVAIVLPYILSVAVLPLGAADWLLRLTPAAGFAIQQAAPQYAQVTSQYAPASGYYPLAPWVGFAVLCGYAAVACFFAVRLLRRRDA